MRLIILILFLFLTTGGAGIAAEASASRDTRTWAPKSTLKASQDVQYTGSQNAQAITHTNVSVDDTSDDQNAQVQQKTEWKSSNTVTVMNNMGASGKIYTAGDIESKTGQPTEKKGVVAVPPGKSVTFNTGGTKILEPAARRSAAESETAAAASPAGSSSNTKRRVLIS